MNYSVLEFCGFRFHAALTFQVATSILPCRAKPWIFISRQKSQGIIGVYHADLWLVYFKLIEGACPIALTKGLSVLTTKFLTTGWFTRKDLSLVTRSCSLVCADLYAAILSSFLFLLKNTLFYKALHTIDHFSVVCISLPSLWMQVRLQMTLPCHRVLCLDTKLE